MWYYRIFDTELGSFAGGSAYLGSVEHSDFLTLSQQEVGRVLIQDGMSHFSAEVMDDGSGITDTFRSMDRSDGYQHEVSGFSR